MSYWLYGIKNNYDAVASPSSKMSWLLLHTYGQRHCCGIQAEAFVSLHTEKDTIRFLSSLNMNIETRFHNKTEHTREHETETWNMKHETETWTMKHTKTHRPKTENMKHRPRHSFLRRWYQVLHTNLTVLRIVCLSKS